MIIGFFIKKTIKAPSGILVTEIDSLKVKSVSIPVNEITQKLLNDSLDSSKVTVKEDENIISLNSNTNIEIKVDAKNGIEKLKII